MGIVKWNLPPETPPTWLDPTLEVKEDNAEIERIKSLPSERRNIEFVLICFFACKKLGLTNWQCLHVVANMILETGWGREFRAYNIGGVKINRTQVENALKQGKKLKWFRAPGNKSSGDQPWCYYRAYDSFEQFLAEWVEKFVPKNPSPQHNYRKTGPKFWAEQKEWFLELIEAGYKGEVTRKNPTPSYNNHLSLVNKAMVMLVQSHLALTADGVEGNKTRTAVMQYQELNRLSKTGIINMALMNFMFR